MAGKSKVREASAKLALLLVISVIIFSLLVSFPIVSAGARAMVASAELLCLLGLIISTYVLAYKVGTVPLFCPVGRTINCKMVLDSRYSIWFGVPSAAFGILFFIIYFMLFYFGGHLACVVLGSLGLALVAERIYVQSVIGRICLYCNATHIMAVCLFVISVALVL